MAARELRRGGDESSRHHARSRARLGVECVDARATPTTMTITVRIRYRLEAAESSGSAGTLSSLDLV
jgi:hypothetical protein